MDTAYSIPYTQVAKLNGSNAYLPAQGGGEDGYIMELLSNYHSLSMIHSMGNWWQIMIIGLATPTPPPPTHHRPAHSLSLSSYAICTGTAIG